MLVTEEGLVVLHDLLVDREGVGQERLILCSVGEDYGAVLAEPRGRDLDGGASMDILLFSLAFYVRVFGFTLSLTII